MHLSHCSLMKQFSYSLVLSLLFIFLSATLSLSANSGHMLDRFELLADKNSPYLQSVIINKGSRAGVLKGMSVLDKDFLIGRVVETNYLSSTFASR